MSDETMELEDLGQIMVECKKKYEALAFKADIRLSGIFKDILTKEKPVNDQMTIHNYSIELTNSSNLRTFLSSSCLWIAYCFWPYEKALRGYKYYTDNLIKEMASMQSTTTTKIKKDYFKALPLDEPTLGIEDLKDELEAAINKVVKQSDQLFFKKFLYEREWWFPQNEDIDDIEDGDSEEESVKGKRKKGKGLDRADVYESSVILAAGVVVASAAKMINFIKGFSDSKHLRDAFKILIQETDSVEGSFPLPLTEISTEVGKNVIYYGAPGTGKSHVIDELAKENPENMIRTVFHADTSRGDFVGALKPTMDNAGSIEYSFAPGPFTQILINALNKPSKHFYLVIEEINRAPAAAVFGEIFQLLDRTENGQSKYSITVTDRDWKKHLENELTNAFTGELFIPSNLSIYATMNSSDQAVMPLDTAFKRRWIFKYQHIDFDKSPEGIVFTHNTSPIDWVKFAKSINKILSQNSIPEDRLLGPWFVTENEINNQEVAVETLKGKVLSYLWDDVLRHRGRDIIFSSDIQTFAQLCQRINENKEVFSKKLTDEFMDNANN